MPASNSPPARAIEPLLLEREGELAAIASLLSAARGGNGGVGFIEGPAGAGKTSLIQAAVGQALEAGYEVLRATGDALETTHLFGIVHQLFDPLLRGRATDQYGDLFSGHAALARPMLLGEAVGVEGRGVGVEGVSAGGGASASDQLRSGALAHGLYWFVAQLCDRAPVLLAVDDLQWSDPSSLSWLLYLARRADQLRVAIVLGSKPVADEGSGPVIRRLQALAGASRLEPAPLSPAAVAGVVRRRAPGVGEELCRAAWEASGGNPFLVEVAAQMLEVGEMRLDRAQLAPAQLLATVEAHLAELAPAAARLARALAIWEAPVSLADAATLADLPLAAAGEARDALATGGWLADSALVALRHPLVRDAVVHLVSIRERDELHRRAMTHLLGSGRPVEEAATHAAATIPTGSADVLDVLLAAARVAAGAGALEDEEALLRRALEEPPGPANRPEVLALLARAAASNGALDAGELCEQAIAEATEVGQRQQLRSRYARLLLDAQRSRRAIDVLTEALGEDDGSDPALWTELFCSRLVALRMDPDHRREWEEESRHLDDIELDGDVPAARALKAELSYRNGVAGIGLEEARRWLGEAVGGPDGHLLAVTAPQAFATAMQAAVQVEEFALGSEVAHRALEHARAAGFASTYLLASSYAAVFLLRCGQPRLALAEVATGDELEREPPVLVPLNAGTAAAAYLELGLLSEAEWELTRVGDGSGYERELTITGCAEALGQLRLAQGRFAEALETFRSMGAGSPAHAGANPSTNLWRSGAARAAILLGNTSLAVALSEEELGLARAWGAPRALGISLTTAALVALDRSKATTATGLLDEAIGVLETGADPGPLVFALGERARRHSAAGRAGDARRDHRRALDLAHRHELRLLADSLEAAMRASGDRPRSRVLRGVDALTPAELRVARAVALTGRSNAEIAADLFVSRKAIEFHLSNAYRKLGVSGRRDLAAVFATPGPPGPPGPPDPSEGPEGPESPESESVPPQMGS
jgi:DNA-binding CsgD family transcriptional regulator